MHAIVPPYLLARIAATREPTWARAAQAARATLEIPREYRPVRSRIRMSIEEPGTLVFEGAPAPDRTISDARQLEQLPGTRVRGEDDPPTGDIAVDEAFDGLGATFDFYWEAYQRSGIDGAGAPLLATVHYGRDYDNAFWNGERMVFGDGDGEVFVGFTGSLSVIAHELTHGVTQHSAGLVYRDQSGALNESVSDVFGALVEQYARHETTEQASWLVGEGLFLPAVEGRALRSMRDPGTAYDDDVLGSDPQPAHMDDYITTSEDDGGVHLNSGIPNRAFVLTADALGGHAWERAGQIWYDTLTGSLNPRVEFPGFAAATVRAAAARYGEVSAEVDAVRDGWNGVGVTIDGGEARP